MKDPERGTSPYAADAGNYPGHLFFYDRLVQVMTGDTGSIASFYAPKADLPPHSDFVRRPAALMNLSRQFMRARHLPRLVVSYNTSSGITADELAGLAEAQGWNVEMDYVDYHKPVVVANGETKMQEVVMVCT